jgi:hypothetical protein
MCEVMITVGSKVTVKPECVMFDYLPRLNRTATGTVTKIYKNGKALVSIDQLRNHWDGGDGLVTKNMRLTDLEAR